MKSELKEIIHLFDNVFTRLGEKRLLGNAQFTIDKQLHTEHFLRFYSIPKSGRINIVFELTSTGVTFWIDKTQEMPDISYKTIKENLQKFEEIIEMIFSSSIHAEYKGRRTVLSFINPDNIMIGQYKFHYGFLPTLFSPKTTKVYDPYFE